MNDMNVIKHDNPKELNDLKNRLYTSKRKRLEMIDGFLDKVRAELDTRDLKDIPTPHLTHMFVELAGLAKKEQPVIELKYSRFDDDILPSENVIF